MTAKENKTIYLVVLSAVFAAMVFVGSMISVPVPAAFGMTRIHLGNIFCLLSGFILGPVAGGLAAGIGSGLYATSSSTGTSSPRPSPLCSRD